MLLLLNVVDWGMKKLLFLLLFIPFVNLNAQNFSGNWGYRINGNEINVYGDEIQNQNNGGRTGTLKVAIWATNSGYYGGTINGYKLYEYTLEPLEAGRYYYDVSNTGWCTYPPSGSYSLTIALLEYISYDYKIVDYQTFANNNSIEQSNVAATLLKIQERKTSKGTAYAVLKLTDLTSVFELFVFSDVLDSNREILMEGSSLILTLIKSIIL